jgi:hypothetical protein
LDPAAFKMFTVNIPGPAGSNRLLAALTTPAGALTARFRVSPGAAA